MVRELTPYYDLVIPEELHLQLQMPLQSCAADGIQDSYDIFFISYFDCNFSFISFTYNLKCFILIYAAEKFRWIETDKIRIGIDIILKLSFCNVPGESSKRLC